jgi:hypothetical protein
VAAEGEAPIVRGVADTPNQLPPESVVAWAATLPKAVPVFDTKRFWRGTWLTPSAATKSAALWLSMILDNRKVAMTSVDWPVVALLIVTKLE